MVNFIIICHRRLKAFANALAVILLLGGCASGKGISDTVMTEEEMTEVLDEVADSMGVNMRSRADYVFKRFYEKSDKPRLKQDIVSSFNKLRHGRTSLPRRQKASSYYYRDKKPLNLARTIGAKLSKREALVLQVNVTDATTLMGDIDAVKPTRGVIVDIPTGDTIALVNEWCYEDWQYEMRRTPTLKVKLSFGLRYSGNYYKIKCKFRQDNYPSVLEMPSYWHERVNKRLRSSYKVRKTSIKGSAESRKRLVEQYNRLKHPKNREAK